MTKPVDKTLEEIAVAFKIEGVINLPTEKDLLEIKRSNQPNKDDVWIHKGNELSKAQVSLLEAQAETLQNSLLWKVLKDEILWQAQKRGLVEATGVGDIIVGKSLIYLTDIIETKLNNMKKR